jgi:hypothetical protein
MTSEFMQAEGDPVQSIIANHELVINIGCELIAGLRSGDAVIIEIPHRIGKRSGPTYTIIKKGFQYDL